METNKKIGACDMTAMHGLKQVNGYCDEPGVALDESGRAVCLEHAKKYKIFLPKEVYFNNKPKEEVTEVKKVRTKKSKGNKFIMLDFELLEVSGFLFSPSEFKVLLSLMSYDWSNVKTELKMSLSKSFGIVTEVPNIMWPSQDSIAEKLHIDVRTVRRAMDKFRDIGIIETKRRFNKSSLILLKKDILADLVGKTLIMYKDLMRTPVSSNEDMHVLSNEDTSVLSNEDILPCTKYTNTN